MPGSITPLPILQEQDDQRADGDADVPSSVVVRYGHQRLIAELPYGGDTRPMCGSKLVLLTTRGIELGEMLTTTCHNSRCDKALGRKDMLRYIDNSGGKDYPFTDQGKVLRSASAEDLREQTRIDAPKPDMLRFARRLIEETTLPMKLVDVELLLGGERIIFHYTSEQWVDFRELVRRLAGEYQTRIEMHQVNAREEARLVADYERCGQHCCCRQFLKVLKPVSMRSAKVQKATLDPTKISGRCGRLMCCLRYEDKTYEELRKRLPHRQAKVMTDDGPGTVVDRQILTLLVLVRLDQAPKTTAYPLENIKVLTKQEEAELAAKAKQTAGPSLQPDTGDDNNNDNKRRSRRPAPTAEPAGDDEQQPQLTDESAASQSASAAAGQGQQDAEQPRRKRRRRRRRGGGGKGKTNNTDQDNPDNSNNR